MKQEIALARACSGDKVGLQAYARRLPVAKPQALIPDLLQCQFTTTRPNQARVTDITWQH
jgi:hypothetical protein